jgi:diguanylate cyclase (GGDEF)-like protein
MSEKKRIFRMPSKPGNDRVAVIATVFMILVFAAFAWISSGLGGWLVFAAPVLPLAASLVLDRRGVRNVTAIVAAIILFLLAQHLGGQLPAEQNPPEQFRYVMRAMILLVGLLAVNWVVGYQALSQQTEQDKSSLHDHTSDALTGLLGRAVIDQALERECARARRAEAWVSLALIEIDEYDGLLASHDVKGAENCLLGVADGLRYCLRRSSDALGRFSPRLLCILMSDTDAVGARQVGEKFRQLIESLDIPLSGQETIVLTVSVGVATCKGRDLAGAQELINVAGQALQQARLNGGNCTEIQTLPLIEAD